MEELQYKAVFSFELLLSSCKIGKEGIDQEIMASLKRQEEKGMYPIKWNRETSANGDVVLKYESAPFTNLTYKNEFVIGDNTIAFTYEERTNQQVMLPNISSYVYMLLLAIRVAEKVNGNFDKNSVKCSVKIENNTDCYFYDEGGDGPVLEDKYGDPIKEIPFIEMINYLEYLKEDLKNTSMSPLIQPCLDLMNAFNSSESSEKYTLLHYGY